MAVAVAAVVVADEQAGRPALKAWRAAHERERKRMGFGSQDAYAHWFGVDPGSWSKWRRGLVAVPPKVGRRIVELFDHDPRWAGLWLRLSAEQEARALQQTRAEPHLRLVGTMEGPATQD